MKSLILILTLILILSGCRSAEDAFLDGQNAEAAGNNRAAVNYYLETIRLKPEMFQAKERLAVAGQKEINSSYSRAESLVKNGQGPEGLAQINALENLHRQIQFHAPNVTVPGNLNHLKDQALTLTRSDLFRQAQAAEQNGQWDQALGFLTEIEGYAPTSSDRLKILNDRTRIKNTAFTQQMNIAEQFFQSGKYSESLQTLTTAEKYADNLEEENLLSDKRSKYRNNIIITEATALKNYLDKSQYVEASERLKGLDALQDQFDKPQLDALRVLNIKLFNTWADDLFQQGKFKESWYRAADALKFEETNQQALALQQKAMKLGQLRFLLLPVISNKDEEKLTREIDTDFNNGPARNMPPFTALVPEFDTRDAFRAFRINPQTITREQALAVAQRSGAAFIIFRELTAFRFEQQFSSSANAAVKKVDNSQGIMEVKKGTLTLNARILYTLVDAKSGHRIYGKEENISSNLQFEQGFLDGPEKNYLLTNQQRSLLSPPGQQDLEVLEKSSAKAATDFFLKSVFPEMEKLVP